MFNAIIICVALLFMCVLLFAHVAMADKFRSEMEAIDKQVSNIQWPVK